MRKCLSLLPLLPLVWLVACSSVTPAPIESPNASPIPPASLPTPAPVTSGGGAVSFEPAPVAALPDWQMQQWGEALGAVRQSCRAVGQQPSWLQPCQELAALDARDGAAVRQYFESRFTAWKMRAGARDSGLITGYYEPALNGSLTRSERALYPVYGVPADLLTLSVPASARVAGQGVAHRAGANRLAWGPGASDQISVNLADFAGQSASALKGRIENGRFVPYWSRAQIAQGRGVDRAPVLAWVQDPVELFFMQVQGAGRIRLDDGRVLRVGVGDSNGLPYQSIGRWLADHGEMPLSAASMSGIQSWVRVHPERQQALFDTNPRYIFFRALPGGDDGPVGSLGVPLTEGYSIAVDPHYIPLGTPVYLATSWPVTQQPLNRLVAAQDTGNAIRGPIRADFFWGYGDAAGENAGRMKQAGSLWLLLPNGMRPAM